MKSDGWKNGFRKAGFGKNRFAGRMNPLVISIAALIAGLLAYLIGIPPLHRIELDTVDLRFKIRGERPARPEIVLAVVDEKSIAQEGKWIWPRAKMAALVNRLSEAGARVIAFDIGFFESDENDTRVIQALDQVADRIDRLDNPPAEIKDYLARLKSEADQDRLLAEAIRNSKAEVVLGYFFHTRLDHPEALAEPLVAYHQENIAGSEYRIARIGPEAASAPILKGILPQSNIRPISEAARYAGHFNMEPDRDGVVRFIPTAIFFQDRLYAPFSLMAAAAYLNQPLAIEVNRDGVVSETIGSMDLPVNRFGQMEVNYRGRERSFPHVPVTDILRGEAAPDLLRDKIVLVGVTAIGVYDLRVTPFENNFPGLEIHANVVDNVLSGEFLRRPEWMPAADMAAILFSVILLGFALPRTGAGTGTLITAGLAAAYLLLTQYLFSARGLLFNLVYPLSMMLVMYIVITVYGYFLETRQKRFIRDAFSHYLAPAVVERLIESPENLVLGGEERVITAFFSDLQRFTSIAESMKPSLLVELLNEFLTEMTDIIHRYEGTVDKFEGDAIIAFFGAPNPLKDHGRIACRAAVDMQKRLAVLRRIWRDQGRPDLRMRIGICTGPAVVGNMGSKTRMDYTMIGDTVNTASRLEGLNKIYGIDMLISETTARAAEGAVVMREVDAISAVGKRKPVTVYQIMGYPEDVNASVREGIRYYEEGLGAYRFRNWEKALACFQKTLALISDDGPARVMSERCRAYRITPPEADWGGVFVARRK